jgi:hypothetical protein
MSSESQSSVVSLVQQVKAGFWALVFFVPLFAAVGTCYCFVCLGVTMSQLKAGSITKEELFAKLSSLQVNMMSQNELRLLTR